MPIAQLGIVFDGDADAESARRGDALAGIDRPFGYWVLIGAGGLGILDLVVSLASSGRGGRSGLDPWIDRLKASWPQHAATDLVPTLREWWEPLLAIAPTVREEIGAGCLLRAGDVDVYIDFPAGEVRQHAGEPFSFRFEIERPLVEAVVAARAVDWSNSLFLSCRFRAWRDGAFNEWVYNFFKSLSRERMRRTEAEAVRRLHPPTEAEPDIELGDWVVQRRCPHRNADLSVFGEIEDCTLTCTLHGWRFDLETGACLTSADHPIRSRRRTPTTSTAPPSGAPSAPELLMDPDVDVHRHHAGVPDEVHGLHRHPDTAV